MKIKMKSAVLLMAVVLSLATLQAAGESGHNGPDPLPGQSEYAERAERLLTAALEAGDDLGTARAQHALAEHMKALSLFPQALTHAELARSAARHVEDAHLRLAVDITYASILAQLDRVAEATEILLASLDLARSLGDTGQEQQALLGLSSAYVSARQLEEARDFAQQGLALARTSDNRVQQVRFMSNLGLIAWTGGDAATASAYIDEAMTVDATDLPPDVRSALVIASITLAGTTGEDNARRARELIDQARRDGSRYVEGFASEQLGQILCTDGAHSEGLVAFAHADRLFRETDRLGDLRRLHERWAACLEADGRFETALEKQREAMMFLDQVHERRQSETLQAHDIAFRTEQRISELARLAEEEQALQARVAKQRALTGWLTAGGLLLLGILAGFWLRNRRLRENRDAQLALQQARIDLLARASHEIRNPAQGIIGILERYSDQELQAEHQRELNTALSAARMVSHLANDYLDLALLEQGKLRIQAESVYHPPSLIKRVETLGRSFLKPANQTLTIRIGKRMPDRVYGDGQRLTQVLLNLISNAAHYASEGEILLSICADHEQQTLSFEVADRGPGFDPSDAANLNPYVRGSQRGSNPRGSGLGLAISARIVAAMDGDILIRNRASGGARISLIFPMRIAGETESNGQAPNPLLADWQTKEARRVLIIDDDPFARLGLRALVENVGGVVEELESGEGIEQTLRRFNPDVVLIDYRLGDRDGVELAGHIRCLDEVHPGVRTIAIISASDSSGPGHDPTDLIDQWLIKPAGRKSIAELLYPPL